MKKKLIEVALPLEAINKASAREKSIRHGHPSTLHLWWARRPLAAARAVIFAQMVDDPSSLPDLFPTEAKQQKERERLFRIIEELVQWENTTNEAVLEKARAEIWQSWRRACAENADHPRAKELFDRNKLPAFHDPFAGGGALPLEAQRLGLESYASDLNPVAVLINKAMIEIPPRFAGHEAEDPEARREKGLIEREWKGAQGLAEDVRYYGKWMRDEAEKRIGNLYPPIEVTAAMAKDRPDLKRYAGKKLTVIAWLWARTVKSPNPAFAKVDVPLASTFMLSTKQGKEAYVEPVDTGGEYKFTVKVGEPRDVERAKRGTKLSRGANFECLMSGTPIEGSYIKAEGKAGRMGARMIAIVAEGERERVYLAPTPDQEEAARHAMPTWKPEGSFVEDARAFTPCLYGLNEWQSLYTNRQIQTLSTFAELVAVASENAYRDALRAEFKDASTSLSGGGIGAKAYAEAIAIYLAAFLSRFVDLNNSLCQWRSDPAKQHVGHMFARQAVPMVWDFAEANPLGNSAGGFEKTFMFVPKIFRYLPACGVGIAEQADAQSQTISAEKVISSDPPYYDNVPYADLSDFFYVWLRPCLRGIFPSLFETMAVPKAAELVATPYRHGGKQRAEEFFLEGMTQAMRGLAVQSHPSFPVTIYYAFKQSESRGTTGIASTGWETFLEATIRAGFATSGTWPMRTELANRMRGADSNALASSIVLVCRKRPIDAPTVTRREFVASLKTELPIALRRLQEGNIAPVDLAQAAIGPGMAIYSRCAKVVDAEGKLVSVREALALINQILDETLAEQEGDLDAYTRFAMAWFEQHGFGDGEFGVATVLAQAKNTGMDGLVEAGILESKRGKVRLLKPAELLSSWDLAADERLTHWESVHHLIRVLEAGGETAAAALVAKLGNKADTARELAYRLYSLCERKKRATEARAYNALVQSWPEIARLAAGDAAPPAPPESGHLFSEAEE